VKEELILANELELQKIERDKIIALETLVARGKNSLLSFCSSSSFFDCS
jgi:hypothetical protein